MLKSEIDDGRLSRREYAKSIGKKEEDLIRDEINSANDIDPVYDTKYPPLLPIGPSCVVHQKYGDIVRNDNFCHAAIN